MMAHCIGLKLGTVIHPFPYCANAYNHHTSLHRKPSHKTPSWALATITSSLRQHKHNDRCLHLTHAIDCCQRVECRLHFLKLGITRNTSALGEFACNTMCALRKKLTTRAVCTTLSNNPNGHRPTIDIFLHIVKPHYQTRFASVEQSKTAPSQVFMHGYVNGHVVAGQRIQRLGISCVSMKSVKN